MTLFVAPTANADPCSSDADCAPNEYCEFDDDAVGPMISPVPAPEGADDDGAQDEGEPPEEPRDEGEDAEGFCEPIPEPPSSECETDDSCPQGQICEEAGSVGSACACSSDDPDCEECAEFVSEETTFYACVPAPCEVDADCGGDLKCIEYVDDLCGPTPISMGAPEPMPAVPPGAPCREGEDCDSPSDGPSTEDCEPIVTNLCGPKWLAPCELDADCGDGFTCVEEEDCACEDSADSSISAGSMGSEGGLPSRDPDGGAPPQRDEDFSEDRSEGSDDDDSCSCVGTGTFSCELIEESCSDNADCSMEGWVCAMSPTAGVDKVALVCDVNEDGEEVCEEVADDSEDSIVEDDGICIPGDYQDWSGSGGAPGGADLGAESSMVDTASSSNPTTGDTGDLDTADASPENPANSDTSSSDSGGCQGSKTSPAGFVFSLMACAWMLRRRVTINATR